MAVFSIKSNKPILIAEDDPNDALLLQAALQKSEITVPIQTVEDGKAVIDYLSGQGQFGDRARFPFPCVIFLDLKMPKLGGLEVLRWLKGHPDCRVVPTIIFSASSIPRDVFQSYELGANCYLVKPASFEELARKMKTTFEFWSFCAIPDLPQSCG